MFFLFAVVLFCVLVNVFVYPLGIAYILKLLDQYNAFDSLHWFQSVFEKYQTDLVCITVANIAVNSKRVFCTQKESQKSLQKDKEDEKLQQAGHLTKLRLELFSKVNQYNLISVV